MIIPWYIYEGHSGQWTRSGTGGIAFWRCKISIPSGTQTLEILVVLLANWSLFKKRKKTFGIKIGSKSIISDQTAIWLDKTNKSPSPLSLLKIFWWNYLNKLVFGFLIAWQWYPVKLCHSFNWKVPEWLTLPKYFKSGLIGIGSSCVSKNCWFKDSWKLVPYFLITLLIQRHLKTCPFFYLITNTNIHTKILHDKELRKKNHGKIM